MSTQNQQRIINTGGGNSNEKIEGTYVEGDYVNQFITLEGQRVEISSDISQTLNDFKDILTETIVQSSDALQAISGFAQELAEQFRNRPDLKVYFNIDEYTSDKELVNGIIKVLLTKDYLEIENINSGIELVNIKLIESEENSELQYKISRNYKGYTIGLLKGTNNKWRYRIQRDDSSFLENPKRGGSYSEEYAIKKAKAEIDKELTEIFDNQENINTPE